MKKTIFHILFVFLLALGCNEEVDHQKQLTYEDFESSLTSEMDYDSIVKAFGQPQADRGSGIHIYVYQLDDATEIWVGYTDKILYANHVDKNQNLLHTLI